MGPVNGDLATLTLTTNKVINEPILNLSVVSQFGSTFQRDYVLLLDPPLLTTTVETNALVGQEDAALVAVDNDEISSC